MAALTAKGVALTPAQQNIAQTLITIGQGLNAPTVAIQACIFDAIFESVLGEDTAWNPTYGGVLGGAQATFGSLGPADSQNVTNAEAHSFYAGGNGYQGGGAIALAATVSDPSLLGPQVTAPFTAANPPPYGEYLAQGGLALIKKVKAEAIAIVGNVSGLSAGGVLGQTTNPTGSSWTVGNSSNPHQDYWTTLNQYAQAGQLYLFSDAETLYCADGFMIMAQTPAAVIVRSDPNVIQAQPTYDNTGWNYTTDHVKKGSPMRKATLARVPSPTQIDVQIICDIDRFRGGDTVMLAADWGPASGIWLIGDCVRSLFQPYSQLTLVPGLMPVSAQTGLALGPSYDTGGETLQPGHVIANMISEAATINTDDYPYVWGGGHQSAGTPSGGPPPGFDCSGAVAAVLVAGALWPNGSPVPSDAGVISQLQSNSYILPGQGSGTPECTLFDNPGVHIYVRLNGKYWGSAAGALPDNGAGIGWISNGSPQPGFNAYHVPPSILGQQVSVVASGGGSASATSGGGAGPTMQTNPSPLSANCIGPSRPASAITAIVLHDSEIAGGGGYVAALDSALESGVRTGLNPTWDPAGTGLSVQCCVNTDGTITRLIPDLNVPFGATYANPYTLQVEQAGFAAQTSWPDAQIHATAMLVAYWCVTFNIPIQQAEPIHVAGNPPNNGIMQHKDIDQAPAADHSDCGPDYPFATVLSLAQTYRSQF